MAVEAERQHPEGPATSIEARRGPTATQFMKDEYPTGKADLMTAFMVRAQGFTRRGGTWAMINLPSWMS
ncbi:MAG: BREX-1 system adenine-specific DNA-methyltransferase PglX, partial [Actinomyces sp.]